MTSTDVDKVYIERIKPRLIEGTPTEDIRRWSVSAHSVMEVTGPSPFGEDGNVLLWLHEKSLTQLFDMCDAVDERFSEIEQAATLRSGECESRWYELFGTPEKAAQTISDNCPGGSCDGCLGVKAGTCGLGDYHILLEWLRGKAVKR